MATGSQVTRITSKDIQVDVTPVGVEGSPTVVRFYFTAKTAAAITGTFRIWVNGTLTAAVTHSTTPATLATNIAAALNHASVLGAAAVAAADSVTDPGNVEVTLAANGYYRFEVLTTQDDGDDTLNATCRVYVVTQGTQTYRVDSQASSFMMEESVALVDMTALSEYDTVEVDVGASATWELNLYEALQDYTHIFYKGSRLVIAVYETGKVVGSKYCVLQGLVDGVSKDFPNKEKVEINISGVRQGKMVVPFNTIYRV